MGKRVVWTWGYSYFTEGFELAADRISPEIKEKMGNLFFRAIVSLQKYSCDRPVPGKKYSEITFPILSETLLKMFTS